jgi:hypothetical protein
MTIWILDRVPRQLDTVSDNEIESLYFQRRYQSMIEKREQVVAYVIENESLGAMGRQNESTEVRMRGTVNIPATDMWAKQQQQQPYVRYIQHVLRGGMGVRLLETSRRVTSAKPGSKYGR